MKTTGDRNKTRPVSRKRREKFTSAQEATVKAAEQKLTLEEREVLQKRYAVTLNQAQPETLEKEKSDTLPRNKGKTVDPRNWGEVSFKFRRNRR